MNAPVSIRLRVDRSEIDPLIEEAQKLLHGSPAWLRWLASNALEPAEQLVDFRGVDPESKPAGAADDVFLFAKPTDKLLRLLAALRAANGDGGAWVWDELHGGPHA